MNKNKDRQLLGNCILPAAKALFNDVNCEHPLDQDVVNVLKELHGKIAEDSDDFHIFKFRQEIIDPLWEKLIEKSIKCLRYFDTREPFQDSEGEKSPMAYGVHELKKYYDKYTKFERLLYGSNRFYRDHVVHAFRTWLSGVELMVKNTGAYLTKLCIDEKEIKITLSNEEKLSMWTIIALTHDLGYPLQKAKDIIDTTRDMVATFITNPDISVDFSFHGVQNYMNDFIVRLMSSRMVKYRLEVQEIDEKKEEVQLYAARLQPKYFFKFQKSLEANQHGILSTLIIYKLLTYFLESDFNINEDYSFYPEDRRQFYIRREILRAIASHSCNDIYQLFMPSFSFLLRICDDTQEWGRKNISELYLKSTQEYELKDVDLIFDKDNKEHTCTIAEEFSLFNATEASDLINRLREQSLVYVTIFRDGQDTNSRDFSFKRNLLIKFSNIEISLCLNVAKHVASVLTGKIKYTSDGKTNSEYGTKFFKTIHVDFKEGIQFYKEDGTDCGITKLNANDFLEEFSDYGTCRKGKFTILLSKS